MTIAEVRQRYLDFFSARGHAVIPSASLVPENDPTTLFTGSGMQPLLPFLLGAPHPAGRRLVNSQKCFRAEDIEEVGDNRHTTFFEMLGNWSLGDYFKTEQLAWFFEFLTDETRGVGLNPARLYVTAFAGDESNGIQRDEEAAAIWERLFKERGVDAGVALIGAESAGARRGMRTGERIFYYDAKKNWWSRAGAPEKMPPGEPGGPDSEVFFDFDPSGAAHDARFGEQCHPNCDCGRFMEIGNSVFMQYRKRADGGFDELPQKNVDFGGGLERIAAAAQDNPDVFAVDCLAGIISLTERATRYRYFDDANPVTRRAFRIVADHIRAAVFLLSDGVAPSNVERGYMARRLIRRAVKWADRLGMPQNALAAAAARSAEMYRGAYDAVASATADIQEAVRGEERLFRAVLMRGTREFKKIAETTARTESKTISGSDAFFLSATHGLPIDVLADMAAEHEPRLLVDASGFQRAFERHQEVSRAGAGKKFKGGLADHSAQSLKYHTATHLLHQALRDVLGEHVYQKGSNITPERLRFDFIHSQKMMPEELRRVEDIVNGKIASALPVSFEILPLEEAKRRGAIGLFDDQYGERVKVYKIGERAAENGATRGAGLYSFEFCGGPHVENTAALGEGGARFKILKEEAVSAGVRRIRAVLE